MRSEGWSVRPSFSPHGPTHPVTLLLDDAGLTQLAGEPAVAWQTPWSEMTNLRLVQRRSGVSVVAVIAHVLYQWRHEGSLTETQNDELRAALRAQGALETPRSRRTGALVLAGAVTLASFGGAIGALLNRSSASAVARALEAINLSARDVSSTWASSSLGASSLLTALGPAPGHLQFNDPATTTTLPARGSPYGLAATRFQHCLRVPNRADRVFGPAGTTPRYQVSSPVFYSSDVGGVQVESTAQYYDSSRSVALDVREMSRASFGRCFAESLADALVGANTASTPDVRRGATLAVPTFVKGWARGGDVAISLPSLHLSRTDLVTIVEAADHYEVTLYALVLDLARARTTLLNLANAMLVRVTSTAAMSA